MKAVTLYVIAMITFLTSTVSANTNDFAESSYSDAFNEVLYFQCRLNGYVTEHGATIVAKKATDGKIKLSSFKKVYYRTCDFNKALEIAVGELDKSIDFETFENVLYFQCRLSGYITEHGATIIAKSVAQKKIELNTFTEVYYKTCNFEKAIEIGVGDLDKSINSKAFNDILYYQCVQNGYITEDGATTVAKLVAKGSLVLNIFKEVYYKTCNFNTAIDVACSN